MSIASPCAALPATAILAAYTINELPDATGAALLPRLLDAARPGIARVLIVEPIARRMAHVVGLVGDRLSPRRAEPPPSGGSRRRCPHASTISATPRVSIRAS